MNRQIQLSQVLFRHGIIRDDKHFNQYKKAVLNFEDWLYGDREIQILILALFMRRHEWAKVANYATTLVFRKECEYPALGWGALALGLRRAGDLAAAKQTAEMGLELHPDAPETLFEACRFLVLDGLFEEARIHYDRLRIEHPAYIEAFEDDEDFEGFFKWSSEAGSN